MRACSIYLGSMTAEMSETTFRLREHVITSKVVMHRTHNVECKMYPLTREKVVWSFG